MSLPLGQLNEIPGIASNPFGPFIVGRKLDTGDAMREYQVRSAFKLYTGEPTPDLFLDLPNLDIRDGTAVHIDMGLGKTVIALTAIVNWFAHRVINKPVLIVAPIKVCESVWRQEARQWSHTGHLTFSLVRGDAKQRAFALAKKADVYLVNPEMLPWLFTFLRKSWDMFDVLLIDESSMFKDNKTKRFRVLSYYGTQEALKNFDGTALRDGDGLTIKVPPHRFKRVGVLTGTPSPNGLLNLWAPMYLCDHGRRLHSKFDTYKGRFFHKEAQVADHVFKFALNEGEDEVRPEWQARDGAPERIHELIADITVELNAEDYGVLPQTIGDASKTPHVRGQVQYIPTHHHFVDLPAELMARYKVLEKEAVMELTHDTVLAQNGGAKSMMCWQIANGAMYSTDERGKKQWTELHSGKLDKLVELIDTINSNTIVTYWFKHDLERIKARLTAEGMAYSTLERNSERVIDRWNAGAIPILLIHPLSAGHGLNLQFGGHQLIWFTMLWSLERYLQMNARLARSGQKFIVGMHHILTRHTTDELQFANLGVKGDDQTRFRAALRVYQQSLGMGLYSNPLAGFGL